MIDPETSLCIGCERTEAGLIQPVSMAAAEAC
jgi:predicted Fe-S protein YdhL (DUF1289 family)